MSLGAKRATVLPLIKGVKYVVLTIKSKLKSVSSPAPWHPAPRCTFFSFFSLSTSVFFYIPIYVCVSIFRYIFPLVFVSISHLLFRFLTQTHSLYVFLSYTLSLSLHVLFLSPCLSLAPLHNFCISVFFYV